MLAGATPPRLRQALFDAQQGVEKSLKAFLIWHDQPYPLTHNLTLLRDMCGELDASLLDIVAPALVLTDFAMRFRYPGALPQDLTVEDANVWIDAAWQVYQAIIERVHHSSE